ncbi:hypothetical protein B0T26DRAFT_680996 [Lasiosphaeria miniovina]|uniref:Uncharacterized protein n=1 Tax=Lasiosphaeria miniovina TaxID=1954250 RepID=A0AA40DJQ8_9PEZI|nr:uncharacterized protein B0T26DRAFT_680996 [Lasiosphaeria miniovina]KAK0703297.1 hypothetical protein B0T26DRAFT_680996 [Lasiosphaeria miniovina]
MRAVCAVWASDNAQQTRLVRVLDALYASVTAFEEIVKTMLLFLKAAPGQSQYEGLGHLDSGHSKPLNIVIIGAGIGGLTAAIRLRRSGHNVQIAVAHHRNPKLILRKMRLVQSWETGFFCEFDSAINHEA